MTTIYITNQRKVTIMSTNQPQTWEETSIPAAEIGEWKAAGFEPDRADAWHREETWITPAEAAAWDTLGPEDIDPGDVWLSRDEDGRPLLTPTDAWEWYAQGFDPVEAVTWAKLGVELPDAVGWRYAGLKAEWVEYGFTVEDAKAWRDAGFSANEAGMWYDENVSPFTPAEAAKWRDAGFEAGEARDWCFEDHFCNGEWLGCFTVDEATKWRDAGYDPESAAQRRAEDRAERDAEDAQTQ